MGGVLTQFNKVKWTIAVLLLTMMFSITTLCIADETASAPTSPAAAPAAPAPTIDPNGSNTGGAGDVNAKVSGKPTLDEIIIQVGHDHIAINIVWTLITGYLVMFMQVGFAMLETGFCRAKNAVHTMAMNMVVYGIGMLGFWIAGFAFMYGNCAGATTLGGGTAVLNSGITWHIFGKDFGIMGTKGFFLNQGVYDVGIFTLFLFEMVFMDTAATIPTGAMAERWKFLSFCLYGLFMSILIYPLFGNWVWGGGWLSQLGKNFGLGHGHVDFAGSSVVHMVGGVCALAGAWMLGPRIGKYNKDGSPNAIPGHHIPMAVVGTLILAFGWFGFNPGSTLAGTDLRIGIIAANTMLASGAGAVAAMIVMWLKFGKPDTSMTCNGLLAGLVAITAPCAFVNPMCAVIIGAIAGVIVVGAVFFVERVLKVDDPVGAVAVHGFNGAWGVLALGLFADGKYGDGWNNVPGTVVGWFYSGSPNQFIAEFIGVVTCFVFVFSASCAVFKLLDLLVGNRVTPEAELDGLDIPEMGSHAYPDFNQVEETMTHHGISKSAGSSGTMVLKSSEPVEVD
jgi:ammonium transporter, Amt family